MADPLRRFLHLERARRPASARAEPPAQAERFETIEAEAPSPSPSGGERSPGAEDDLGRFREPLRAASLELDLGDGGEEQPFRRCARCETDAERYAQHCPSCGADLQTEAQRAFNARLWAARCAEARALEQANNARREAVSRAEREGERTRREVAEALAREVGRRERARLQLDWGEGDGDARPWGLRLLACIRDPRWRWTVGMGGGAALVLAFLGGALAHRGGIVVGSLIVITLLSVPPGWWSRGGRRW